MSRERLILLVEDNEDDAQLTLRATQSIEAVEHLGLYWLVAQRGAAAGGRLSPPRRRGTIPACPTPHSRTVSSCSTAAASLTAPSSRCPRASPRATGFPTNALYGLSQMLLKIVDEYRPASIVVRLGRAREDLPPRGVRGVQGAAAAHAGAAVAAVAAVPGAHGGLRDRQPRAARLRGGRHPRHARRGGQAPGRRLVRRHRRPRRHAGRRRGHLGDEHGPRHHRRQDLHAGGRARALRRHARPDPRLHRAQGRHQRQHPRRARHRREDRRRSSCSSSAASTRSTRASTRSRARSAASCCARTRPTRASP